MVVTPKYKFKKPVQLDLLSKYRPWLRVSRSKIKKAWWSVSDAKHVAKFYSQKNVPEARDQSAATSGVKSNVR